MEKSGWSIKSILLGVVGVLALQALLIGGYLLANEQDPIVLNPDRGGMVTHGVVMVAYCGPQSGKGILDTLPANGRWDTWSKGRAVQVDKSSCTVWYHHHPGYTPCHAGYTFDRVCPGNVTSND